MSEYLSNSLIKSNLGRLLVHVDILEESTVHIVSLLLDSGSKLEEVLGDRLVGTLEDVYQAVKSKFLCNCSIMGLDLRARVCLVLDSEKGDGLASLASSSSTSNAVDVILNSQGELRHVSCLVGQS